MKIYRAEKRLGLIAGKNFGGRKATGDVVVFLDAHIEANVGWFVHTFKLKGEIKVNCPFLILMIRIIYMDS